MTTNMGTFDRAARVIIGLGLLAMAFIGPQTPWGYVGIIPLITALVGFCPAYRLIGFDTCSKLDRRSPREV